MAGYGSVKVVATDALTRQSIRPSASWRDFARGTRSCGSPQGLTPGPNLIELCAAGYQDTAVSVQVLPDTTVTVEVTMRPRDIPDETHGVLRVSVRDSLRGFQLGSALVVCRDAITGMVSLKRSDDGYHDWTSFALPGGPYWVVAGHIFDYEVESTLVGVKNGEIRSVQFALTPPERVLRVGVSMTVQEAGILNYAESLRPVWFSLRSRVVPDSNDLEEKARLNAWRTWQRRRGSYAIAIRYTTVEGDPIDSYLVVDRGRCLRIEDCTRDGWGLRRVYVDTIASVRPVWRYYDETTKQPVIVPWSDTLPAKARLQLELNGRNKEPSFY